MLRELILFLEEFLHGHGPPAVAKAAVGLMSFAVLIGAVLGSTAIKAGGLVAAILVITTAAIALLAGRRTERRELQVHKDLLSQYCKLLDKTRPSYQIIDWDKTAIIGESGDTRVRLSVKLKALHDDFRFVRLRFGCGWPQHRRYRRRIQVIVRNVLVDGTPGTTLRTTTSWPRDGAMALIVHFHTPPAKNAEVSFSVDLTWPKMCAPLLENNPDEFALQFWQPVSRATYRVLLPKGHEPYVEPIGTTEDFTGNKLDRKVDDDGREMIVCRLSDLPIRHRAGVRLQLKEKRRSSPR